MKSRSEESLNLKGGVKPGASVKYAGVPTFDIDDVKDEKPWQRIPSYYIVLVLGTYMLLAYFAQLVEDGMPAVVKESQIGRDMTDTFSEETAWSYLRDVIGEDSRVAGTPYHLQKTREMKQIVDNIAAGAVTNVRTDWQIVTDHFDLGGSRVYVNYYSNLSNIIAVLEGESGFQGDETGSSILINCHYDTVPFVLGASDNAVFCAVMLECLSKLSRRRTKLKHNIVFLFNGAEEIGLQASHGFLKHPWAKGINTVVNLDAAGMNGKPTLFQVTDPRVLAAYSRATPRPNAQSMGEFLFGSGIIPSDTDFRVWRDFGEFYGIDLAFSKWGHVYHTRDDRPENIQPGVIQAAGDMLLGVMTRMADDPSLAEKVSPEAAVYYDYMNAFMISYSLSMSYLVDTLYVLFALLSVWYYLWVVGLRQSSMIELLWCSVGRLLSAVAGLAVAGILMLLPYAANMQLRYLSMPWLVGAHYWLPYILTAVTTSQLYDQWRCRKASLNRSIRCLQAMAATRLVMVVVVLLLMCVSSFTTVRYTVSVPLFLMSVTSAVSVTVIRYVRIPAWQHCILEVALSIPTVFFLYSVALRADALLLPIMARGSSTSPDLTVGIMNIGLAAFVATAASGIELLFSRTRLWMVGAVLSVVTFILLFIPFSPYQDEGPATQRHNWFHLESTTYGDNGEVTERSSGVMVSQIDAYSRRTVLDELDKLDGKYKVTTDLSDRCDKYVYCNLPLYRITFGNHFPNGMLIDMGPPATFSPVPSLTATKTCSGNICELAVRMIGAPHNTLTILPVNNSTLIAWSMNTDVATGTTFHGDPFYNIVHSVATYSDSEVTLDFSLTFNVTASPQSQHIVQISHSALKLYNPEDFTEEYKTLLSYMPKYFNIDTTLAFRNNYYF